MTSDGVNSVPTALSVGHVTHDRYASGIRAGGSAFYGARALRALGARSRLVSTVGVDFERHAELEGLEILLTFGGRTTAFENTYSDVGARVQRVAATGAPVTTKSLPADWRRADVFFLAPVFGEIEAPAWLDAVDATVVGLGLQGFLKSVGPAEGVFGRRVARRPLPYGADVLDRVDVVFLSHEDLHDLASPSLLAELRRVVPTVVLTLGSQGSRVWSHGAEYRVGTFPVDAEDPTGAGDVFAAAFLFASMRGADPGEAARFASAAASIVVEAEGGSALDRLLDCGTRAGAIRAVETRLSVGK